MKLNQEKEGGLEEQDPEEKAEGTLGLGTAVFRRGFLHHEADNEFQEVPTRGDPDSPLWSWCPPWFLLSFLLILIVLLSHVYQPRSYKGQPDSIPKPETQVGRTLVLPGRFEGKFAASVGISFVIFSPGSCDQAVISS